MEADKKLLHYSYQLENFDDLLEMVRYVHDSVGTQLGVLPSEQDTSGASSFINGKRYFSPITYFWPDYYNGKTSKWNKILTLGRNLGIVIFNRSSGDWTEFDENFKHQAELARIAGANKNIFYVKTQYGVAQDPEKLGKNVPNPEKYTIDYILYQIGRCIHHYGDLVDGVFLDEFITGWEDTADRFDWYNDLVNFIRQTYGKDFLIVGNCGARMHEKILDLDVDVFMSYESDAAKYVSASDDDIHADYMKRYPGKRFWHVIHDVTRSNIIQTFEKVERLGIGHVYVTDGKLVVGEGGQWDPQVNPYENNPSDFVLDMIIPWINGLLKMWLTLNMVNDKLNSLPPKFVKDVTKVDGGIEVTYVDNSKNKITI